MRRGRTLAALVVATGLLAAGPARAVSVLYTARPGDSPERIAAEVYGNRALAWYIREVNGLPHAARLRAGQHLRVPTALSVHARTGDTLAALAQRYLGDARRASFLAAWSHLEQGKPLAEGAEVLIPYQLAYRVRAPQTMAAIATLFFNDAAQAAQLAAYNFRTRDDADRGETVMVPLPRLRARQVFLAGTLVDGAKPVPADHPERDVVREPAPAEVERREAALASRVEQRLGAAEALFRDGSYEKVPGALIKLLAEEDPSEAQLVAIHRLLGFAYVALGTEGVALQEFGEVLERDPQATLDPALVSPKLRAVFERARQERVVRQTADHGQGADRR